MFHTSISWPYTFLQYISVVGPHGPSEPVGPQNTFSIVSSRTSCIPSSDQIFFDSSSFGTSLDPSKIVTYEMARPSSLVINSYAYEMASFLKYPPKEKLPSISKNVRCDSSPTSSISDVRKLFCIDTALRAPIG